MRINNIDIDEDTGRYLHMEMLFAALNQHTEGIYIKGDAPQPKLSSKEKKKAQTDNPEYANRDNNKEDQKP